MNQNFNENIKKILHVIDEKKEGDVVHVSILHDDDCPALKTNRLADCTCKPKIERMIPC